MLLIDGITMGDMYKLEIYLTRKVSKNKSIILLFKQIPAY